MKSQRWHTVGGNTQVALMAMLLAPLVAVIFLSTPTFADDGTDKPLASDNTSKLETPKTEASKEVIQETPVVTDEPEKVEPPVTEPPVTPEPPLIATPGTPVVTSPPNDKEIIWEWTPAVPPTPTVPQPTEPEVPAEETPVEQPPVEEVPPVKPPVYTGYGWELFKDGTSVDTGKVGLDVLKWTTKVSVDGTYTFRIWTIAEDDLKSAWTEAHTTIKTPIVPPVIFVPIKEAELLPPPAAIALRSYEKPVNTVYAASNNNDAVVTVPASDTLQNTQVLSAQSDSGQEAVAAVVKPSTQGWVLFNVPWYVWLLVAAIIFTTYRWVRVVTARNAN